MKIIRYGDSNGAVKYAASAGNETPLEIIGDIFGHYEVSTRGTDLLWARSKEFARMASQRTGATRLVGVLPMKGSSRTVISRSLRRLTKSMLGSQNDLCQI